MTILGLSEAALIMIQDILSSTNQKPVLEIVNNLKINPTKEYIHSEFELRHREDWAQAKDGYVVGAMLPNTKKKIVDAFQQVHVSEYFTLRHKASAISTMAEYGNGCLFDANCTVAGYAKLGNFVTAYANSVISHHCEIGDFVTLCPSASLAGGVKVGNGTMIGIGACVKNGVTIGSNCLIGAGSVVVKDIPNNTIVKGNPAR